MIGAAQLRETPLQIELFSRDPFREELGELFVQKPKLVKIECFQFDLAHSVSAIIKIYFAGSYTFLFARLDLLPLAGSGGANRQYAM